MRFTNPWATIPITATLALVVGSTWWAYRPRPTLDGVAEGISSGRYEAAEGQLRGYLAASPGDARARLMLARVLVDRPKPDPEAALGMIEGLSATDPRRAIQARVIEGDAHFRAGHYERAEPAWLEAIRLEPTIPEVGRKLLDIYALQGRDQDSRRLALRLFAAGPDRRDRVELLLRLIRDDAHPVDPGSVVRELEPIVRANPADLRSSTALGLALVHSGRSDEGVAMLRRDAWFHGGDPDVRLGYVNGLIATGDLDELAKALDGLPGPMAESPRFDAARGWLAAQRRDLDGAAEAYRRALDFRPTVSAPAAAVLAQRLQDVLRRANRAADLAGLGPRLEAIAKFPVAVRESFDRLREMPDLGTDSHPEEFERLAAILGEVGRDEEAGAWAFLGGSRGPGSR